VGNEWLVKTFYQTYSVPEGHIKGHLFTQVAHIPVKDSVFSLFPIVWETAQVAQ
jgi:hypothetical protein